MENQRISFIGGGNMAEAILRGALDAGVLTPDRVVICDISEERNAFLKDKYHVETTTESSVALSRASIVILAVKPNTLGQVLTENKDNLTGKAVVSIVAGWASALIREILGKDARILRIMPNTPALAGEGMSVFCAEHSLADDEYSLAESVFMSFGRVLALPERYFDAVTAVSGSGPAYVFIFIEAMADGGVKQGLPRPVALELAAQTVLGSAKMVLDSGLHPGALKDAVCSPGGTTIEAVSVLEKSGFRGAVIEAVDKCAEKSRNLH